MRALPRQLASFLTIGVGGVLAYLAVFLLLRTVLPAHAANVVARVGVAVPTTWLNARHTFRTRASLRRVVGGSLLLLTATTALSSAFLAVEQALAGTSDRPAEVATLVLATAVATAARFTAMRRWLFRPPSHTQPPDLQPTDLHQTGAIA